ncbi:MAG TPA: FAD-dependent oxidoreductase [Terriglobales bacterium]|jgi:flavin-dependent dehydrogenase
MAIIGAGPAGAHLAARLAAAGRKVWLFDEKREWEKPCGGGVTDKALRAFPFLNDAVYARNPVRECDLTSPEGRTVRLALDRAVAIFSRTELNRLLLDRARAAGVEFVQQRVVGLAASAGEWQVALKDGKVHTAPELVLATGARNPFRHQLAPGLGRGDWMATAGYYIDSAKLPWPRQRMVIRFLPALEGYIWSFPRHDHASVGICGKIGQAPSAALRRRLEDFLDQHGIEWQGSAFYSHLLPAPSVPALRGLQFAGHDPAPWAMVGDAAGLVDPITGEGIFYALYSAELLARSVTLDQYAAAARREIVAELSAAAGIADRFYRGRFLGAAVLERMVQFSARSATFRGLMCDLFSGSQSYGGLRRRLYRNLVPTLVQLSYGNRSI